MSKFVIFHSLIEMSLKEIVHVYSCPMKTHHFSDLLDIGVSKPLLPLARGQILLTCQNFSRIIKKLHN